MNYESRAISLLYYKYGEGSVIAKVFTEELGLISYSVRRSKSKKSKNKISLLDNQCLISINGKYNNKNEVQYLNELNLEYAYEDNTFKKKLIRMFISEVLSKTLSEAETNQELFHFVWQKNIDLDRAETVNKEFSLIFLLEMSYYLGIYPSLENIDFDFFNINRGVFTKEENKSEYNLFGINLNYFKTLLKNKKTKIPSENIRELMEIIFTYYTCHHFDLLSLKSYEIIKSLD